MNKKLLAVSGLSIFMIFILCGFGGDESRWPGGSPAGYTGSPLDGKDCTNCHNGSATTVDNWISSNIPVAGYTPGETYNISVSVSGNGDKGFLVSPQNPQGSFLGTLTAGLQSKIVGTNYITHSSDNSANPAIWDFQWTAPAAGSGNVTFYGAFTVSKPVTRLSTLMVPENTGTGYPEIIKEKFVLYPNPAKEFAYISDMNKLNAGSEISIIDINGRIVHSEIVSDYTTKFRLNIPYYILSGIYLIKIQDGTNILSNKLFIL